MSKEINCATLLVFFLSVFFSLAVVADDSVAPDVTAVGDTIIAKHRYIMGDNDSKADATKNCFLEAKRKAIEYAGIYVESTVQISQTDKTRSASSNLKSFAAALVSSELVSSNTGLDTGKILIDCVVKTKIDKSELKKEFENGKSTAVSNQQFEDILKAGEEKLFADIAAGKLTMVKAGLELGVNPNVLDANGWTPLHLASNNGQMDMVMLLVKHGAEINSINFDGNTPLLLAAMKRHDNIVNLLLRNGANPNIHDEQSSPLILAIGEGDLNIAKQLVKNGARVNDYTEGLGTPLILCAKLGHLEIVKMLLASGADISRVDKSGATALHPAALNGHTSIVKLLLAKGADVNKRTHNNESALLLAVFGGRPEIVKMLLDKGAEPNVISKDGISALDVAALYDHREISSMLYAKGARKARVK